jgi:hypothetical protein
MIQLEMINQITIRVDQLLQTNENLVQDPLQGGRR